MCAIYDNNISPSLLMIIIKIIILYFIQIRHTDDFPPTGTLLVCIMFQKLNQHFINRVIAYLSTPSPPSHLVLSVLVVACWRWCTTPLQIDQCSIYNFVKIINPNDGKIRAEPCFVQLSYIDSLSTMQLYICRNYTYF